MDTNEDGGGSSRGPSKRNERKRLKRIEKRKAQAEQHEEQDQSEKPSEALKKHLLSVIYTFFTENDQEQLQENYMRYGSEGVEQFKADVKLRMLNAINDEQWQQEKMKAGFSEFFENRIRDAVWNAMTVLIKFIGTPEMALQNNDEEKLRLHGNARVWQSFCKPFSKKRTRDYTEVFKKQRQGSGHETLHGEKLLYLSGSSRVISLDDKFFEGGYARVRRVRIEGERFIPEWWTLAAKEQRGSGVQLRMQHHQNEALALPYPIRGAIKYLAIHPTKNEGYTLWWNGGTVRRMCWLDGKWGPDPNRRLADMAGGPSDEDYEEVRYLLRFRNKRTALAWTFINIMKEVHSFGLVHNDLSPDNVLLHFPLDESKVFIGVCDWGLASQNGATTSLYVFRNDEQKQKAMSSRWWVDPSVMFVPKNPESDNIPAFTYETETYSVSKIASWIYGQTLDQSFFAKQSTHAGQVDYPYGDATRVLQLSIEQLEKKTLTISRFVNRFMARPWNWDLPGDDTYRGPLDDV